MLQLVTQPFTDIIFPSVRDATLLPSDLPRSSIYSRKKWIICCQNGDVGKNQ